MEEWRVYITPAAERAAKRLPKEARRIVLEVFPRYAREDPYIGKPLSGPLAQLRSFHFTANGQPYRIAYELEIEQRRVVVSYAGHRSDFYERLKRRLGV